MEEILRSFQAQGDALTAQTKLLDTLRSASHAMEMDYVVSSKEPKRFLVATTHQARIALYEAVSEQQKLAFHSLKLLNAFILTCPKDILKKPAPVNLKKNKKR